MDFDFVPGAIKSKLMCLSRVDGRTGYKVHGLNVGGEPCVWCGGGSRPQHSTARVVLLAGYRSDGNIFLIGIPKCITFWYRSDTFRDYSS